MNAVELELGPAFTSASVPRSCGKIKFSSRGLGCELSLSCNISNLRWSRYDVYTASLPAIISGSATGVLTSTTSIDMKSDTRTKVPNWSHPSFFNLLQLDPV